MNFNIEEGQLLVCTCNPRAQSALTVGKKYPVQSIWYSDGVAHPRVIADFGKEGGYYREYFDLADDEIPEVGSSRYQYEVYGNDVEVLDVIDSKEFDQVLLIQQRYSGATCLRAAVMKLDPDDALTLAHDLTRMAMQIKRRENA